MKIKLFVLFLLVFTNLLIAQDEISFGVKGGINYSNVSRADLSIKLNSKVGFHLGGVIVYNLTEKFLIQTEPMFSRQGYIFPEDALYIGNDGIPVVGKRIVNLNYINLPFIAGYELFKDLSVQAGPQIGIGLGGKVKFKNSSTFVDDVDIEDSNFELSIVEVGILGGLQYILPSNVFFQVRYVIGLTGISGKGSFKNENAQISVGYKFN